MNGYSAPPRPSDFGVASARWVDGGGRVLLRPSPQSPVTTADPSGLTGDNPPPPRRALSLPVAVCSAAPWSKHMKHARAGSSYICAPCRSYGDPAYSSPKIDLLASPEVLELGEVTVAVMDPYKYLSIRFNPDGSLTRYGEAKIVPAAPAGEEPVPVTGADGTKRRIVSSNDVPLNDANGTSVRLFVPAGVGSAAPPDVDGKLPLILYFHGGGYVLFRAASEPFHNTCAVLAATIPAAVASVDYRLAPEHRLPAAYDDAGDAVRWIRSYAAGSWPGRPIFIMGCHAGASIAFRAALAAVDEGVELRGLILNQAHHSGVERTAAEEASVQDRVLPLPANDLLWELALPVGGDRDHEYSNPATMLAGVGAARLSRLPPCLVLSRKKDPPRDRQRVLVDALRKAGVAVDAQMDGAGYHAMELFKANCAAEFTSQVANFVRRHAGAGSEAQIGISRL